MAQAPILRTDIRQQLQLRQEQHQRIRFLELPRAEVARRIREAAENPFLQIGVGDSERTHYKSERRERRSDAISDAKRTLVGLPVAGSATTVSRREIGNGADVSDRLHFRIRVLALAETAREAAYFGAIVDSLDAAGYLQGEYAEVARSIGVTAGEVKKVVARMNQIEPGVGARSPRECYLLQLVAKGYRRSEVERFLEYAPRVRNAEALATAAGIAPELARRLLAERPRPVPWLDGEVSAVGPARVPDFVVTMAGADVLLELGRDLPVIAVDKKLYTDWKSAQGRTPRAVHNEYNEAVQLSRDVEHWINMTQKIVLATMRQQLAFLTSPTGQLKPLRQRDVANILGVHHSRVSRVVRSKVVQTPRGLFDLEFFFPGAATVAEDGSAVADHTVMTMIQTFIAHETRGAELSDPAIARLLAQHNLQIARRTVTNYRTQLGIAPVQVRALAGRALSQPLQADGG